MDLVREQEEKLRAARAIEKITKILEEENCRAEAVMTFFGDGKRTSEVQILANPVPVVTEEVAQPVEAEVVQVEGDQLNV